MEHQIYFIYVKTTKWPKKDLTAKRVALRYGFIARRDLHLAMPEMYEAVFNVFDSFTLLRQAMRPFPHGPPMNCKK